MIPKTFFDEKTFEKTKQAHAKGLKVLAKANELLPTLEIDKMTKAMAEYILFSFEPDITDNPIWEAARKNLKEKFKESGLISDTLFKSTLIELERSWQAFFHTVVEVHRKEFKSYSSDAPNVNDCDLSNFVIGKEIKLKPDFEKILKKQLTFKLPDECSVLVSDFEQAYEALQSYLQMVYGEGFKLVASPRDIRIGGRNFVYTTDEGSLHIPERTIKTIALNSPIKSTVNES